MKKLYILPFDHRSSFSKDILNIENPNANQKKKIEHLKMIIFKGMIIALEGKKDKNDFSILIDEKYGKDVIKNAQKNKIKICLPVEKSGENQLKFDYGKKFKEHILKIKPDFVKVLVRYNPKNTKINKKQLETLSELYVFCKENGFKIILELLVPPTKQDFEICKDKISYDKKLRAQRTVEAIKEIKTAINPDIWKLEGFDKKQWECIIKETKKAKIIILGRGEDNKKVKQWLQSAAKFNQIIGFAIGRTIFMSPIKKYYSKEINAEKASLLIARKFLSFVSIWEKAKNYENL
ncbi:MAG: DUF2090 domain-containing protein [Candidatus Pacebacteria bacterium]|nr:DUF2090 domain-containing protein [Candidatus Paceibacterota bacterium]